MEQDLGMEVYSLDLCSYLMIINLYFSCVDTVPFWKSFFSKSLMGNLNMVIGGDMNFYSGMLEAWGPSAQANQLAKFFLNKIASMSLVEIDPIKPHPTLRNKRIRAD